MFQLSFSRDKSNKINVRNEQGTNLELNLDEGARILNLSLQHKSIIKEIEGFSYQDSYASAILFPFVSRVKNGEYYYHNVKHQLYCNNKPHALHGLVYDKPFTLVHKELSEEKAILALEFVSIPQKGFPFSFKLQLIYTLTVNGLSLKMNIMNNSQKAFPFTVGWHPYFYTSDIKETKLNFNAIQKVTFDDELITKGLVDYSHKGDFVIQDKDLDDCFLLSTSELIMTTRNYCIKLGSTVKPTFLQLYTPKNRACLAIEFQSGISNSYNNKIGLQTIEPNQNHSDTWFVQLIDD